MKYFYKYIFFVLCLLFIGSCKKDEVGSSKKLLGKWSLSADYWELTDGSVRKGEYNPEEEIVSLNFISKDEVVMSTLGTNVKYEIERVTHTVKYTFNESTGKLIFFVSEVVSEDDYVCEIILLDSKTMKYRHYNDKGIPVGNNVAEVFSDWTFDKL